MTYYDVSEDASGTLMYSLADVARLLGRSSSTLRKAIESDVEAGLVAPNGLSLSDEVGHLAFPFPWLRIGRNYHINRSAVDKAVQR